MSAGEDAWTRCSPQRHDDRVAIDAAGIVGTERESLVIGPLRPVRMSMLLARCVAEALDELAGVGVDLAQEAAVEEDEAR